MVADVTSYCDICHTKTLGNQVAIKTYVKEMWELLLVGIRVANGATS